MNTTNTESSIALSKIKEDQKNAQILAEIRFIEEYENRIAQLETEIWASRFVAIASILAFIMAISWWPM